MTGNVKLHFLIAGAQKSGTTALASFLAEHPALRLPHDKEAHVFDAPDFSDAAVAQAYERVFQTGHAQADMAGHYGDATPIYLFLKEIPERVHRYNPDMKWILVLRDPVDRALSHHSMERRRGLESLPAFLAFLAEPWRLWRARGDHGWMSSLRRHSYLVRGDYARQLSRLLRWFPREQVLILRHSELLHAHEASLRRIYAFLGVVEPEILPAARSVFADPSGRVRRAGIVRHMLRLWFLPSLRRLSRRYGIDLGPSAR